MTLLHDFDGLAIRLTDERRGHILEHPEYLCVVVKMGNAGAFVLTAYLTDRIKKGERLWPKNKGT